MERIRKNSAVEPMGKIIGKAQTIFLKMLDRARKEGRLGLDLSCTARPMVKDASCDA